MKTLTLIFRATLLWLLLTVHTSGQERPGQGRGNGTGGIVSNQVIVATVANLYTNSTPHYLQGIANIGTTTAGSLLVNVTNSSNVRFGWFSENVGTAGATSNQISFVVPPGGWWKFAGVTTTIADGSMALAYYATNGSVSYATSAGAASSATSAATATNALTTADIRFAASLEANNLWIWYSSMSASKGMKAFVSQNGWNWYPMTTNAYDYRDPDYNTNNANGPISTECAVQYDADRKQIVLVYNYDPYNTNANAQALGIVFSSDGTNFPSASRILIWPNGITNGGGATFAATWFTDPPTGSNYLVYGWHTGIFNDPKDTYLIRRLDNTYTNWSAPLKVITANSNSVWDGHLIYNKGRYELYTYMGGCAVYTNSVLTNAFTYCKTVADADGAGEAPYVFVDSEYHWRLYSRGQSFHGAYIETYNGGESWSKTAVEIPNTGANTGLGWHAPGIMPPLNASRRMPDGGVPLAYATRASFDINSKTYSIEDTTPIAITNFAAASDSAANFTFGSNGWMTNNVLGLCEIAFSASCEISTAELLHVYVESTDGDGNLEVTSFGGSSALRWPLAFFHQKLFTTTRAFRVTMMSDIDPMDVTVRFARLRVSRISP